MTDVAQLCAHFEEIATTRMRGVPICNAELEVEAVGFREFAGDQIGVLITPWFMNLVLLPGDDRWDDSPQGERCELELPSGPLDFTAGHDPALGTTLTAVLFRTVSGFPDQQIARDTATETLRLLMAPPEPAPESSGKRLSRRALLRGGSDAHA